LYGMFDQLLAANISEVIIPIWIDRICWDTVTRVTVELDQIWARIRVPRINLGLDTFL
jgi:hypothetical protein